MLDNCLRQLACSAVLLVTTAPTFAVTSSPEGVSCLTTVPAGLVVNQHWDLAGSPYCVSGDIQVSLLTIDPGVCVLVDGDYAIEVLSSLSAVGSVDQPIVFTAKDTGVRWKGLRFQNVPPGSQLEHCEISYSHARGLTLVNSAPTVRDCRITNNTVVGQGAGIYIDSDSTDVVIEGCQVDGNDSTSHGGGLRAIMGNGHELRLLRSSFTGNRANPSNAIGNVVGGGVHVSGASTFEACTFSGNRVNSRCNVQNCQALARGGGAFLNGDASLVACAFLDNVASAQSNPPFGAHSSAGYGGGVFLANGTIGMDNCIVAGNSTFAASGSQPEYPRGSGIYVDAGAVGIRNCSLARNLNHGLYRAGGSVEVSNSILYFNNGSGAQVGGTATIAYSCVENIPFPNGENNIPWNPVFAGAGTQACDIQIVLGSLCIDAGDPAPGEEDACSPPGLGASRNDMGAHGGPRNCDWGTGTTTRYCLSEDNSTGSAASIHIEGSMSLAMDAFTLTAGPVPDQPGLFYFGPCQIEIPFGNGHRCVGGQTTRLPVTVATGGMATFAVVPSQVGIGAGNYNFQFWFRDPPAGGAFFNLSDAMQASFAP